MKHRRILFFLLVMFSSAVATVALAQSQFTSSTDVVHLKTGQTHQGLIIEQKPGESISLWRSAEADTLTFAMDVIDRITKAVPTPVQSKQSLISPKHGFNTNPWSFALQASNGGGDYSVIGFGGILQKRFPTQRATLGLGLHYLGAQNGYGVNTMPIVLHSSYEFSSGWKGRFGSLGFLDLGCSVNMGNNFFDEANQVNVKYGNGLYFNTGVRFRINVLQNTGVWFDIGYLYQNSKLTNVEDNKKLQTKAWHVFQVKGALFF